MSLKIDTKGVCGRYLEVKVEADNVVVDLGIHSKDEIKAHLASLKETVEEMERFIEE